MALVSVPLVLHAVASGHKTQRVRIAEIWAIAAIGAAAQFPDAAMVRCVVPYQNSTLAFSLPREFFNCNMQQIWQFFLQVAIDQDLQEPNGETDP